jgi:tetratricopeptide (TPR) repeat protein
MIILTGLSCLLIGLFLSRHTRKGQNHSRGDGSYLYQQGLKAYQEKDYPAFLRYLKDAVRLFPDDAEFTYALARAHALNNDKKNAVKCLEKTIRLGYYFNSINSDFDVREYADFHILSGSKDWAGILKKIERLNVPVRNSQSAYLIPDRDLWPEGIAYDPVGAQFYVGSIYKRKIVTFGITGQLRDFTKEMQNGLWSVSGMKVDAVRRTLWANSAGTSSMKDARPESLGLAGVFKYDLVSGGFMKNYLLPNQPDRHLFNDLVISSDGDVFVTDTLFKAVYLISHQDDELRLFCKLKEFGRPNGIALTEDEKYLYVAHSRGIAVIELRSKKTFELRRAKNIALSGIDGLYFYKNSLIAIQNGFRPVRICRFFLNRDSTKVIGVKVIESGNPLFELPTTGVLDNSVFYYIANSQLNRLTAGKGSRRDGLNEIVILRAKL